MSGVYRCLASELQFEVVPAASADSSLLLIHKNGAGGVVVSTLTTQGEGPGSK